ncbi:MAG: NAD(P)-binding domain-containing protein, partial [Myxococcota bacterium]
MSRVTGEIVLDLAFLCLGVMGYPMAGHLARAGHRVTVYNRTPGRRDAWLREYSAFNVQGVPAPAEAAAGAEFVFVCTGNDTDLREVLLADDGALDAMPGGSCLV